MAIATTGDIPAMPRPDEIEDAILHQLDGLDVPQQEGGHWTITDEGSADWALRKLSKFAEQLAAVNEQSRRQLEAIEDAIAPFREPILTYQAQETNRLTTEIQHWESVLIQYHRSVLADDDKAISIKLPHGVLSSRKQPDKWEFDEDAVIAWAAANAPEFVRVKQEVDKALIKKTVKTGLNGEVVMPADDTYVPGISVTVGERKFEITTEAVAQ